jgi:hypothetical protein
MRQRKDLDSAEKAVDAAKRKEMRRIFEFSQEVYGNNPNLTQEEVAECLKRIKRDLVESTFWERANNYIPIAVGPRVAHVRMADPIDVSKALQDNGGDSAELRAKLLQDTQASMQRKLDELVGQLDEKMQRFSGANPFFRVP